MGYLIAFVCIAAIVFLAASWKRRKDAGLLQDTTTADSVKTGIKNGWYTAILLRVNDKTYVQLTGKKICGWQYSGTYKVSEEDWQALKEYGVKVEE